MPSQPQTNAPAKRDRAPLANTAFLVESMLLLFFLVAALAVFTQIFASSVTNSANASRLSAAVEVAQNAAEEFSANPQAALNGQAAGAGVAANGSDGFRVSCDVEQQAYESGTLYTAHISVADEQGTAYELDATSFQQGGAQ